MMPSKLDRDQALARKLVEEYQAGATLHVLACRYQVGWQALRRTIVAHGVEIRPPSRYIEQGLKRPKRGPLPDEEVERLRRSIGFDPSWVA